MDPQEAPEAQEPEGEHPGGPLAATGGTPQPTVPSTPGNPTPDGPTTDGGTTTDASPVGQVRAGRLPRRAGPVALVTAAVLVVGGGTAWLAHRSPAPDRAQGTVGVGTAPSAGTSTSAGGSAPTGGGYSAGDLGAAPTPPLRPGEGGPTGVRPPDWPAGSGPSLPGDPTGTVPNPATRSYTVDGNRLTVWFWAGVCETYALRADESQAGKVAVRVVVAKPVPKGQACIALAKYQKAGVALAEPLGDRTVVDADDGEALSRGTARALPPQPSGDAPGAKSAVR